MNDDFLYAPYESVCKYLGDDMWIIVDICTPNWIVVSAYHHATCIIVFSQNSTCTLHNDIRR